MKKIIALSLCIMLLCAFLCGCEAKTKVLKETDEFIVITPSEEFVGKTLKDCMDDLKTRGELEFSVNKGMISSINGIDNPADYSYCWMLYTDDAENGNDAWGTIEHAGKTYASATLGAESLVIAKGCVYIWVYTKF